MGKQFYRKVIRWLAANDEPENMDASYMRDSMLVAMGAGLTDEKPDKIAADVIDWRKNPQRVPGGIGEYRWNRTIPDGFITVEAASKITGLSVFTMRQLCKQGAGPEFQRYGTREGAKNRMFIFKLADVERWKEVHANFIAWHIARWTVPMKYEGADAPKPTKRENEDAV